MERFSNLLNGYGFETSKSIKEKKEKITKNLKDTYNKTEKHISVEELEKKLKEGLNAETKKYIENEKMNDYLYNETKDILRMHRESLNEYNRQLQSERDR